MVKDKPVESFSVSRFINKMLALHKDIQVDEAVVQDKVKSSLSIKTLIENLAEAFRLPETQIEQDLKGLGFEELIDQYNLKRIQGAESEEEEKTGFDLCRDVTNLNPFTTLFGVQAEPDFSTPIPIANTQKKAYSNLFESVPTKFAADPFIKLYREGVSEYFEDFMTNAAPQITAEIKKLFGDSYPKYLITTGIGANEQFNHFVASINNSNPNRRLTWLIINSPKRLELLPDDATVDNTLFMEFSRSSVTEETIKIHEYTPRNARRIVFSNKKALQDIGDRDGNLVLRLPDQVSGRYGRNKTPILLAPMYVAGMDVETFWKDIECAVNTFDISNPESLPFVIAKFILVHQKLNTTKNFIYLGCNDDELLYLCDEFVQFWNEGVNKGGNDLLMSRFFGLPRDSHMNIEGLLGNRTSKMAIFLLRTNMRTEKRHPLVSSIIDPINKDHAGLHFGDEEVILAFANYKRFSELMPAILIEVPCQPSLKHAAIIGQLFADVTFIYSRLNGIDPGSNPEVKSVRDRSAEFLSKTAKKIRADETLAIEEAIH